MLKGSYLTKGDSLKVVVREVLENVHGQPNTTVAPSSSLYNRLPTRSISRVGDVRGGNLFNDLSRDSANSLASRISSILLLPSTIKSAIIDA